MEQKYYIFTEDGIPKLVKDQNEYAKWAIKAEKVWLTEIKHHNQNTIDVITEFNFSKGIFTTFIKDNGVLRITEESPDRTTANKTHDKHVRIMKNA